MRKPSLDTFERVVIAVATNPVTAATSATLGVLSNPFRETPVSGSRYYNRRRRYSNFVMDTDELVKACPNCDARYGVESRWHRAGQFPMGDVNMKPYTANTFCDEHLKDAFKAQEIIVASKPIYKGE